MRYEFTKSMKEISGFGGGYEATCQSMVIAGLEWLDDHPSADPQFHSYKNIYGVMKEDNEDAKSLSKAMVDATRGDCTGAMHQATVSTVLWIKKNGWKAYVEQMTDPEGEAGILRRKLEEKQKDYDGLWKRFRELDQESDRRGEIIAAKILGWKKYKVDNDVQECYAPTAGAALSLDAGDTLHKFIDEAIKTMEAA